MERRRRESLAAITSSGGGDGCVTVRPSCGPVLGAIGVHVSTHEESDREAGDDTTIPVACFKGIPYAQPPVGAIRFAEPRALPPWSEPLACTSFGEQAVQGSTEGIKFLFVGASLVFSRSLSVCVRVCLSPTISPYPPPLPL